MDTELNVKLNNVLNGTSLKAIQDKNNNDITDTYLQKDSALRLYSRETNEIPLMVAGEDLNDHKFLKPGVYCCTSGIVAQQIENTPYKSGNFRLITMQNTGATDQSSFWGQQWILGSRGNIYARGISLEDTTPYSTWQDIGGSAIIAKSFNNNGGGYIKYASGLIFQWGYLIAPAKQKTYKQFYISFPNICVYVTAESNTNWNTNPDAICLYGLNTYSKDGFTVFPRLFSNGVERTLELNGHWFAIGY